MGTPGEWLSHRQEAGQADCRTMTNAAIVCYVSLSEVVKWWCLATCCLLQVILHGEHSVVYGKTALAASVDLRTQLVIKVAKEIQI